VDFCIFVLKSGAADFCHQNDIALAVHGLDEGLVGGRIGSFLKENVEDHERTAIVCQSVEQSGVNVSIPALATFLMEESVSIVVHEDDNDFVGRTGSAKAEKIIVTGVGPA